MTKKLFRRQLVVRPGLQYGLVALMAGACALGCIATHLFYYLRFPPERSDLLVPVGTATWISAGAGMLVFLPLVYYTLVISNRLAGPIYRLIRHMDSVVKGDRAEPVKFRAKDFHPDLAEAYNRLLDRIVRK